MHLSDVVLSLSGVVLVVGLVRWAMGSALARLDDEGDARTRIAADHPDFQVGRLALATDGRSALAISLDGREAVLLFTLGRRITCWRMARARVHARWLGDEAAATTLLVSTGDFTLPRLRLTLADAASARALVTELQGG
jgi:hypothetical protein